MSVTTVSRPSLGSTKPSKRGVFDALSSKIGLNPVLNARRRIQEIEEHLCLLHFEDEKGCIQLLNYCQSSDPSIQLPALFVVVKAILHDWSLRSIFLDILNRRGRTVDFVVDSWKKDGVEYREEWNLYYGLARVCLIDTVVSETLDAVGEEDLDDAKMADLIIRSSEDEYQSTFVLGLMFEESSMTQNLLRINIRPSRTFRALASVISRPQHLGAGPTCKARQAVDWLTGQLLDAAWEGVDNSGFDLECTGAGIRVEEWGEVTNVVKEVRTWKSVFKEAHCVAAKDWRGAVRVWIENTHGSIQRDDALALACHRLARLSPRAE